MVNTTKKNNKQGGFTLIETLVAVAILMIAVVAPMSFAGLAIKSNAFARDRLVALYELRGVVDIVKYCCDVVDGACEEISHGGYECISKAWDGSGFQLAYFDFSDVGKNDELLLDNVIGYDIVVTDKRSDIELTNHSCVYSSTNRMINCRSLFRN